MRKTFLLIVFLSLMLGCSLQKPFLSATDRHFVRSDDFHEYRGLYVYTLAQDSKLFFTHYPEKKETLPISQKIIGTWEEKDGLLSWRVSENRSSIVYAYTRNSQGVYVGKNSKYYVPVELIPIKVNKDGLPLIESTSGHSQIYLQ
jgi:hypothetical protein